MESKSIFKQNFITLTHVPTILLIVGYLVYWVELYFMQLGRGRTSPLALILFLAFCAYILLNKKNHFKDSITGLKKEFLSYDIAERAFFVLSLIIIAAILMCVLKALLLPPHLCQEYDSLNYHLTIPKQHLIIKSFKHIRWSSVDLRALPLDFALAPYWFVTKLPNKLSQIMFIVGLAAVSVNLVRKLGKRSLLSGFVVTAAIFGSHGLGIQMGVLMLDLVICYLFIAAIDSFLKGRFILCAIELSFFIWSKPFFPMLFALLMIMVIFSYFILRKIGINKLACGFEDNINSRILSVAGFRKLIVYLIVATVFIAGPFIAKSIYYAGTPLYPFFPGVINLTHLDKTSNHWRSIVYSAQLSVSMKDGYGSGKGILDFVRHLWVLAVPEKGVNNRFDYPLGLPYLLFLALFLYFTIRALRLRRFAILAFLAMTYWLFWWFGSQQARFLYMPLLLIFITVSASINRPTKIFLSALLLALTLNGISIFRAHYEEFPLDAMQVLRPQDKELLKMNEEYYKEKINGAVTLDRVDVAYADFPVKITDCKKGLNIFWTLEE